MDEAEAIRRSRAGDRESFRWLVERDGDLLLRTAYLLVRDRGLAEDLAQESFLAAWQGLGSFRTPTGFRPWLMRILINRVNSHGRRRRFFAVPLDGLSPEEDPPTVGREPAEAVFQDEDRRALGAALMTLPDDSRRLLVLRYYAGLSVPEIARSLDLPEGTVKSRLHRALERMRAVLDKDPGFEREPYRQIPRRGEQG